MEETKGGGSSSVPWAMEVETKGRGGGNSIPSGAAVETKGRGGEGKAFRKGRREEEEDQEEYEEGRSGEGGKACAAKSRRIDGQIDSTMDEEEEDEYGEVEEYKLMEVALDEEDGEETDEEASSRRMKMMQEMGHDYIEIDEEQKMRDYRAWWESLWSASFGSFEDTTSVPAMRYTHGPIPVYAICDDVMQIFSIEVGLQWPLHVYGLVAIRDSVDHNRNLLFHRTRDDCQILTQQDSFLQLTGPSRTILLIDPVEFDILLKVKGRTESDDQVLSFQFFKQVESCSGYRSVTMIRRCHPMNFRRFSKLKFTYAILDRAVEATICRVKVVRGSWAKENRGRIVCSTSSLGHEEIELLDSRHTETMPIGSDDVIKLSRRVVNVELRGELIVCVTTTQVGDNTIDGDGTAQDEASSITDKVRFRPNISGESCGTCKLGFCEVEITVAWSLLAMEQEDTPLLFR
uniref:DUF6598 domain-containing protein n=1 Tax=Oryza punctata TaxID=4537 RepID=A0A0E0KRQ0_ORYPU